LASGPSDDELLREARGGAREALCAFVDRHLEPLFGYADLVTCAAADASAAVQDAFLDTFIATREEGESVTEPAKRLWRRVHETSLKAAELRRRGEVAPVDEEPEVVPPEDDLAAILRRANMELPPRQREVVVMHELEDFSYELIANVMDLSPFTVAQLSWRGLGRMRALMRRDPHGAQHVDAGREVKLAGLQCDSALTLVELRKEQPLRSDEVAAWLDRHLAGCAACANAAAALDDARETVDEARETYRRWARVRAGVGLRDVIIQDAEAAFGAEHTPAETRPESAPKREPLLRRKVGDLRGRRWLAIPATAAIFLTLLLGALATLLMTFEGGDGTPPADDRRIAGLPFGPLDVDDGDRGDDDDERERRDPAKPACRGADCDRPRVCRGADCDELRVCRGRQCDRRPECKVEPCDRRPVCTVEPCDRRPVCTVEPCDRRPVCTVEPCDRRPVCKVEPCDRRPVCKVEPCDRRPVCTVEPCDPRPCPPHCPPPCPPDCPPPPCPPDCPPPPCPPDCPPPECPPDCDPPVVRRASGPPGLGGDLPPGRGGHSPPGKAPGLPPGHGGAVLPPGRGGTPPGQGAKLG
jgi:DNA-directed RNA polymerase specialized sigma24 family protein